MGVDITVVFLSVTKTNGLVTRSLTLTVKRVVSVPPIATWLAVGVNTKP